MIRNDEVLHSPPSTALLWGTSIKPVSSEAAREALVSQLLLLEG